MEILEIKHIARNRESIEWIIIRLYTAEERISETEDQIKKNPQTET